MDKNATRAKSYRELAARIRYIAEDMRGEERRSLLLKVATDYKQRALHLEDTPSTADHDAAPRRRLG